MDILEAHGPGGDRERGRTRLVGDFRILGEQVEHGLDVDDRLLHLAIEHAHEIQRLVQLDHHGIDQHEIANRVRAIADTADAHDHHHRQADGEDDALPRVQHGQRHITANRQALIACHGLVVAFGLTPLRTEILDGLVVQQAVDGLGIGIGVALVHGPADRHAPVGGCRREPKVESDHHHHDERIAPIELVEEHCQDQGELNDGRDARQHAEADNLFDGCATTFENTGQTTGLALQMKAQRQAVQMHEDLVRKAPHRIHRDRCKQRITPLREQLHERTQQTVECRQGNRPSKDGRHALLLCATLGQRIGCPLEREGHSDGHELGDQKKAHCACHAQSQIRPVMRPYVGPQAVHGSRQGHFGLGSRLGGCLGQRLICHDIPGRALI